MILNLKKRVDILTNENTQLRNLLKKNDNNQTTSTGTTSIVQAQQPIAPIRNGSRKISAKSISDYDIQDDLGDTQSIRLVIFLLLQCIFGTYFIWGYQKERSDISKLLFTLHKLPIEKIETPFNKSFVSFIFQ